MDLFKTRSPVRFEQFGEWGYMGCHDALAALRTIRSGTADLVFLDPPFNLGKDYGTARGLEQADPGTYEKYVVAVLKEAARVLKPGGSLFFYHLPIWASRLSFFLQSKLEFRHWIAIAMKNGFVRGRNLYPAHYALLYYSKGEPVHFSRPRIPPRVCASCKRSLLKDYGGYRAIIDEKGVNLSDFWDDLSPVRHKGRKLREANQLPIELTDRVMAIAGVEGGLMIDPFVGTGTSLVSAVKTGMKFIGIDLEASNLAICRERLNKALASGASPQEG